VNPANERRLAQRIAAAAEAALADRKVVTSIDVLVGIGWLSAADADLWRQGRLPYLERAATANLKKLGTALRLFRRWAELNGLQPSETVYVAWTRDRRRLRFSKTGEAGVERAYRTHWVSPGLANAQRRFTQAVAPTRPGSPRPDTSPVGRADSCTCGVSVRRSAGRLP